MDSHGMDSQKNIMHEERNEGEIIEENEEKNAPKKQKLYVPFAYINSSTPLISIICHEFRQ